MLTWGNITSESGAFDKGATNHGQPAGRFPPKIHKIRSGEQALKSFCVFYFVDFRAANKQNGICAIKITQSSRDTPKKRRLEENCNEFYFSWILCETFGSILDWNRTFIIVVFLPFSVRKYGTGKQYARNFGRSKRHCRFQLLSQIVVFGNLMLPAAISRSQ